MRNPAVLKFLAAVLAGSTLLAALDAGPVWAHGGVVFEEDLCVIEIGLFKAHFTVYQPQTRASEEFCEDIPDVNEAVFVMDYLHDSLREVPVDFRIIKDVQNLTLYANWDDVQAIPDLDAVTVFYHPPEVRRDASFSATFRFLDKGGTPASSPPSTPRWISLIRPFLDFTSVGEGWDTGPGLCCSLAEFNWATGYCRAALGVFRCAIPARNRPLPDGHGTFRFGQARRVVDGRHTGWRLGVSATVVSL